MKYSKSFKRFIICSWGFVVTALLLGLPLSGLAIEYGGIGGRPAYPRSDNTRTQDIFVHVTEAGQLIKEGVRVINNSTETKTLLVYATDSTPSTDGAFACKQLAEKNTEVGGWIKLAQTEVTLKPIQSKVIDFTIKVPEKTLAGEYNGCIVIQEMAPNKTANTTENSGLQLSFRTALRVALTIPGELFKDLAIDDFKLIRKADGKYLLNPVVSNTGNVSVDAYLKLNTRNIFGLLVARHEAMYPVLRQSTAQWNFEVTKVFWGGLRRSTLEVAYDSSTEKEIGATNATQDTILTGPVLWHWVNPQPLAWLIYGFIFIIVLGAIILGLTRRRRDQIIRKLWKKYSVKSAENIESLAKRYNTKWRKVARINRLKPPYNLRRGMTLLLPPKKHSIINKRKSNGNKN